MQIIERFITNNDNYKSKKTITVKGLMLHSVGCPQPDPNVFINNFNKGGVEKGVHAFLGADGTVLQTLPWEHRAWHCGSGKNGSGNNTHIGVEMTEPATIKYTGGSSFTDNDPAKSKAFVEAIYKVAVELFAFLAKKYNLDPLADGVIISHSEGCKRGIASNHGDVEHLWRVYGLTMDKFRQDVKAALGGVKPVQPQATPKNKPINLPENRIVPFELLGRRMDVAGAIIEGKTFAHVRPLVEGLGFEIGMKDGIVVISKGGQTVNTDVAADTEAQYKIRATPKEVEILQNIVYCEARGEDEKGQILVANVIFNRVNSKGFPNTVEEVVFQKNAFEPTRNGAYENANPGAATITAVQKALSGVDYSQGATFFRTIRGATEDCWHEKSLTTLFDHGAHRFYC